MSKRHFFFADLRIAGTKMGFSEECRQGLLLFLETLGDSPYITALDASNNDIDCTGMLVLESARNLCEERDGAGSASSNFE